ncbi:hypothetical protein BpHYR1_020186, partial [Brachionus plicatilis]
LVNFCSLIRLSPHILLKNSGDTIKSIQCNIVDDVGNLSDHRALYLDIFVFYENDISNLTQKHSIFSTKA